MHINTRFDFTTDTKGFWESFWENNRLGQIKKDPDAMSRTMWFYQYCLYRRILPNGEFMDLQDAGRRRFLWKGRELSSDSIINNMRFKRYPLMEEIISQRSGFREDTEEYLHRSYTIGGAIIFPVRPSINSIRGNNYDVSDRFDLTLFCIKKYYEGCKKLQESGLDMLLQAVIQCSWFFDSFVDFKGYVDYFFLNDLVDEDYNIKFWLGHIGRPNSVSEYNSFVGKMMDFLNKRNARIGKYANS